MTTSIDRSTADSNLSRFPQFPGHKIAGVDYYSDAVHGTHQHFRLGDFTLENGTVLENAQISYRTHGTLSPSGDNAILFPHMYSGTPKAMESFILPGRALDPSDYFIILPGQFGNGFSTSPTNQTGAQQGGGFPDITIGDDVRAQHQLVTKGLGIDRLQLVLGWSMGAQQAYEWAVRHPAMVARMLPIAGTARTTPHSFLTVRMFEDSITSDPGWADGDYTSAGEVAEGIRLHAANFSVLGVNSAFYRDEVWRNLDFPSLDTFYEGFWQGWFGPMDPNNLLCMARKWRAGDVTKGSGTDLATALGSITAKTTVIGFEDDLVVPAHALQDDVALVAGASFRLVDTQWGHFAPMGFAESDRAALDDAIDDLLATPV